MRLTFGLLRTAVILALLIIAGCPETPEAEKAPDDFIFIRYLKIPKMEEAFILQDKETGVKYLYVRKYKDGGITRYIEKEER
jgi:hypothetical protein